jgi:sugar lactone lactonase YvrE
MSDTPSLTTLVSGLRFPEAPRWHGGRLWFSDFFRHAVYSVPVSGDLQEEVGIAGSPSGLGWDSDGNLIVVSMHDRRLLAVRDGVPREVADLSAHADGHCNDMVVDASGRAYVGNFGFDLYAGEAPRPTCLLRVDPDGSVHRAADQLWFPNGMVLTPDGSTLIVAETHAHRLTAFDAAPDGRLSGRRVFADLPGSYPDGLCLDAEGAVWAADARGHRVLRVREGAAVLQVVSTGARRAYACMLGGDSGTTLFVCTATAIGPAAAQREDGRIEFTQVEVPHAGRP